MKLLISLAPCFLATLSFASAPLPQSVFTVDLDPLAGADFQDIQSAIDAAEAGDTLLVGPGDYVGFSMTKGLAVIGSGLTTNIRAFGPDGGVQFLPGDELAVLADVEFGITFDVRFNRGRVVFDSCKGRITARRNEDVRCHACVSGALVVRSSNRWVESNGSSVEIGIDGASSLAPLPRRILITNPSIRGLDAFGSTTCFSNQFFCSTGGVQGDRAELIVAGRSGSFILGGDGCPMSCIFLPGSAGIVLEEGSLRLSGVAVSSQDPTVSDLALGPNVQFTAPPTVDPTLRLEGVPRPGASVTVTVDGAVGDEARLEFGVGPTIEPSGVSPVPRLVLPGRIIPMGQISTTGAVSVTARIPAGLMPGTVFWVQGWTVTPSGEGRRTNSLPMVVRP